MSNTLFWALKAPLASLIIFVLLELFIITIGVWGWLRYRRDKRKRLRQKMLEDDYWSLIPEMEEGPEGIE